MIALQRDCFERRKSGDDPIHDGAGGGSPVDIITDKYEDAPLVPVLFDIRTDMAEQARQEMVLAVYVADGVDHHAVGHARLAPRGFGSAAPQSEQVSPHRTMMPETLWQGNPILSRTVLAAVHGNRG